MDSDWFPGGEGLAVLSRGPLSLGESIRPVTTYAAAKRLATYYSPCSQPGVINGSKLKTAISAIKRKNKPLQLDTNLVHVITRRVVFVHVEIKSLADAGSLLVDKS